MIHKNIAALWENYFRERSNGGGVCYRNLLVEEYSHLVRYSAERINRGLPFFSLSEKRDLVSAGTIGLIGAIEKYDPHRGVKFEGYCTVRIRGAILDELRTMDPLPYIPRAQLKSLQKAGEDFYKLNGRNANDDELARELGISERDYAVIIPFGKKGSLISLEEIAENFGFDNIIKKDKSLSPFQIAERKDQIYNLIGSLRRDEKLVVCLRYFEGMRIKEIGKVIGVKKSRVNQIIQKVLANLKQDLEKRRVM